MSFCNIQIGGSCFANNETRTKNFTAPADLDDSELESINAMNAHDRMYASAIVMLEDFRRETRELDEARVRQEQLEQRQAQERERGDRAEPAATEYEGGKEVPK